MAIFGKKRKLETQEGNEWNELLKIALTFNKASGTWTVLPQDVPADLQNKIIEVRKIVFEYIRQLKEAKVYSQSAVRKFAKETYPWISKDNIKQCIQLGQYL